MDRAEEPREHVRYPDQARHEEKLASGQRLDAASSAVPIVLRHCERSEAIQGGLSHSGLLRFSRNDGSGCRINPLATGYRSEEHTSELQSLMRISYAVFCLKKKTTQNKYI